MELYVGHRPWATDDPSLAVVLQDRKVSGVPPAMPLGLGSAFATLPPPPPLPELRFHDTSPRYLWDHPRLLHPTPHHAGHHTAGLVGVSTAPGLDLPLLGGSGGRLGTSPLVASPLGASNLGATTLGVSSLALAGDPHHHYRIAPYMEHLYHSLHSSPQASLRGLSPFETRVGSDYLGMSGLAATRLSDPHLVPSTLTSADLSFSIDGSRLASPRPSLRQSRKRALSSSPYSDSFDLNSMIRFSPNSLVSIMNASRTSSASGSYGHLSFITSQFEKKDQSSAIHILEEDKNSSKAKSCGPKDLPNGGLSNGVSAGPPVSRAGGPAVNGVGGQSAAAAMAAAADDDGLKEEPPDFIETHCHWKDCNKEFNTPDELVKHINSDHIHANKKSFVCRWKECSRTEKPFKAQYMLVVHMRRHTGEKPHRCTFEGCYKAYSRLENLKTHLRSHTGEKPYMCEFPGCTKAFSNASDRAKHQNRTHSNEKPYVCKAPGCTKRYTDPSSLRKHVKTVHGADFYASKKHKGNDHPNGNSGGPGSGGGGKDMGQPEGSPHSDGGKAGSMSSPSVKSEDATSPGDQHSPDNIIGGVTPMDQSRLDIPLVDGSMPHGGRFESRLDVDAWGEGQDEDLDASLDLPLGLGGGGGNGVGGPNIGVAVHEQAMRYRPMKGRMQTKGGLINLLPNLPGIPRRSNGIATEPDFGQRISDLKMGATTMTTTQTTRKTHVDYRNGTSVVNNRRDSTSTVSTGYFSMQSPNSRRPSELSQASCLSGGRQGMMSSPYDHISIGSSRRNSDNSNYNFNCMGPQTFRPNQRGLCGTENYNTSNLVVQTQNMSLSQENLTENWAANNMGPTMGNSMSAGMAAMPDNSSAAGGGQFGYSGPMGPVHGYLSNSRDMSTRRASDPVRPLDNRPTRGRLTRTNSYSNFSQMGSQLNQRHPNQGLQLDQVGDDEPIENKLILPDDMVNYLNQKEKDSKLIPKTEENETSSVAVTNISTMPSPAYTNQPVNSPAYSNANINSPAYTGQTINSPAYTNQPINSPAYSAQTPNTPQTYPNIASPPTPYQYGAGASHTPSYNAAPSPALSQHPSYSSQNVTSPAAAQNHYNTPMPSPARPSAAFTPVTPTYPTQASQSATQNFMPSAALQHGQPHQQQQYFAQYAAQQTMAQHQMYNQMMSHQQQMMHHQQQRHPANYGMSGNSYPQHICGHFASLNVPPATLQLPCPACQNRSSIGDMYPQNHNNNWQVNSMGINPHYNTQHSYNQHVASAANQNINYMNHYYTNHMQMGGAMMNYSQSIRDIQCGDVSQSSQSKAKGKSAPIHSSPAVNTSISLPANGKIKSPKDHNNENNKTIPNISNNDVIKDHQISQQQEKLPKNPADIQASDNPTDDPDNNKNNNYMKQDTYQRTLEYVQQCQNWSTAAVKDEVSSTTDQKPNLNPNGTVTDYATPGPVAVTLGHPEGTNNPASSLMPPTATGNGFLAPLAGSLIPSTNMVLNNLTSSLNSLQQETKYLQMLQ